jgi:hypothetical protein
MINTPKKRTVQLGDVFEDTAFKQGFEIAIFLNQVVESHLFTTFEKMMPPISDIELIQINTFLSFLFQV